MSESNAGSAEDRAQNEKLNLALRVLRDEISRAVDGALDAGLQVEDIVGAVHGYGIIRAMREKLPRVPYRGEKVAIHS